MSDKEQEQRVQTRGRRASDHLDLSQMKMTMSGSIIKTFIGSSLAVIAFCVGMAVNVLNAKYSIEQSIAILSSRVDANRAEQKLDLETNKERVQSLEKTVDRNSGILDKYKEKWENDK